MDLCHLHLALVSIGAAVKGADASQVARLSASADCQSLDTPNQHSQSYPDLITGNLNGTTLIVPISLEIAQEVIPDEYEIAEQAYRELLPSFPDGMYPMVAQIVHDHDIRVYSLNTSLADFSVSCAALDLTLTSPNQFHALACVAGVPVYIYSWR